MRKLKKGFTLVELMVVITVIAILMTIAIVSFTRIQKQARDTKRKADIRTLQTALQAYFTEFQAYPIVAATAQPAGDVLTGVLDPTYIPSIPIAPKGAAGTYGGIYSYVNSTNGFTYAICSNLETATDSGAMWVVSTSNAGGYGTVDGECTAPAE
jgi:prepilin-type N-terminal cleavage/methylation domain-containing protein